MAGAGSPGRRHRWDFKDELLNPPPLMSGARAGGRAEESTHSPFLTHSPSTQPPSRPAWIWAQHRLLSPTPALGIFPF